MLIECDLVVMSAGPDSLDVQPRGDACYSGFCDPTPNHVFREPIYAAGFKYEICGRCGTVRISERFQSDVSAESRCCDCRGCRSRDACGVGHVLCCNHFYDGAKL